MTIQTINIGTTPNDGTGDPARTAFTKLNANFTQADNAASKLVATNAQAIAGTAGVLPDAADVHAAFGQYGLGSKGTSLGANFDFNSQAAFIDGSWRVEASPVNGPSWSASYCQFRVNRGAGDTVNQTVYDYQNNRISYRTGVTTEGNVHDIRNKPWREIYHTGNAVGTVSQSGGVPTGAIIERGSNSNGEYTKFADGTMICTIDSLSDGRTVSGLHAHTWNLPAAFINTTYFVAATTRSTTPQVLSAPSVASKTTNVVAIRVNRSSPDGTTWDQIAIGRWY